MLHTIPYYMHCLRCALFIQTSNACSVFRVSFPFYLWETTSCHSLRHLHLPLEPIVARAVASHGFPPMTLAYDAALLYCCSCCCCFESSSWNGGAPLVANSNDTRERHPVLVTVVCSRFVATNLFRVSQTTFWKVTR